MTQHMHAVLLVIEVFWVGGVLAIFVFYFILKHRVRARRRRERAQTSQEGAEGFRGDEARNTGEAARPPSGADDKGASGGG